MDRPAQPYVKLTVRTALLWMCCAFVILIVSLPARAVLIDGRDWSQPLATTNFSYLQAAEVCSTITGVCNGAVENPGQPSVDLTGLIWASQDEVTSMFRILINEPGALFDPQDGYVGSNDSHWVSDAIDFDGDGADLGLFNATNVDANILLSGRTRTAVLDRNGELKAGRAFIRHEIAFNQGRAVVDNPTPFDAYRVHTGLWLYRVVPEPSVAYLLIAGLLGIRLFRK